MNSLKHLQICLVGIAALVLLAAPSSATTVPGTANPFLAGHPNGTACCGGDSAPGQSPVLALGGALGGAILTFSATGGASYDPNVAVASSADGLFGFDMTADYGTGISGPLGVNVSGLLGVFITDGVPGGAAPAQRNDGMAFASIAPALYQIFWIGDGLTGTGSGSVQQFLAPGGATRLFLGVADGFGWWNNIGSIEVTINGAPVGETPLPGALPFFASGVVGLGLIGWRRKRKQACRPD
jgi:hypothetical protein